MLKTARSSAADGRSLPADQSNASCSPREGWAAPIWSQHSLVSSEDEGARVGVGSTRAPRFHRVTVSARSPAGVHPFILGFDLFHSRILEPLLEVRPLGIQVDLAEDDVEIDTPT